MVEIKIMPARAGDQDDAAIVVELSRFRWDDIEPTGEFFDIYRCTDGITLFFSGKTEDGEHVVIASLSDVELAQPEFSRFAAIIAQCERGELSMGESVHELHEICKTAMDEVDSARVWS